MLYLLVLAQITPDQIQVVPDGAQVPGTPQLQALLNGGAFWALLACVAAIVIGAALWAFGSRGGNYQAVEKGKSMVLGGAGLGALVGAAAAIVRFFWSVGQGVGVGP